MLRDITQVKPLRDRRLWLRFDDGSEGEVDLDRIVRFEGVFAELADPSAFERVRVAPGLGTVVWPNGADLDPDVLYAAVTGREIGAEHRR